VFWVAKHLFLPGNVFLVVGEESHLHLAVVRALQSHVKDFVYWEPCRIWSNVLHTFRVEDIPLILRFKFVTILFAGMLGLE